MALFFKSFLLRMPPYPSFLIYQLFLLSLPLFLVLNLVLV